MNVRFVIRAAVVPVLFLITLFAWALSSPVGSSPDDDFHLSSIWCGWGDREGLCEPTGDPESRMVPSQIATKACFAYEPRMSGACTQDAAGGLSEAIWMNANGLYPRGFYAVMSTLAGDDVAASVVAIRFVNAAIAVLILVVTFWLLPRSMRAALVLPVAVILVPFGLFLTASTNPSSWAYLSAAVVWISLYGAMETEGRRRTALSAQAVLGAVLGAGARVDAAAFAVFGVFLAWILAGRSVRRPRGPVVVSALIVVIAVGFYASASQGGSVAEGLPNDAAALTLGQHVRNFILIPVVMWSGVFGQGGLGSLGWLDTSMPTLVPVLTIASAVLVVVSGLRRCGRRRAWACGLAVAAMWTVPFVLLAQTNAVVGTFVQSRYILPLVVIAVAVATATVPLDRWAGWRSWTLVVSLSIAASVALHVNLRRYTTGSEGGAAIDPGRAAQWWWDVGPSPLVVWLVGSVAFAAGLALLARIAVVQASIAESAAVASNDIVR